MNTTFLLLGSNLGDSFENLITATNCISNTVGNVLTQSSIYQSPPWGFEHENYFLNQVLMVETLIDPQDLLVSILDIETKMGRLRNNKGYESRIIDIDILFYKEVCIDTANLKIPHPLIEKRRFTLMPLAEIAPKLIHPQLGRNMMELLDNCMDFSDVKKI